MKREARFLPSPTLSSSVVKLIIRMVPSRKDKYMTERGGTNIEKADRARITMSEYQKTNK